MNKNRARERNMSGGNMSTINMKHLSMWCGMNGVQGDVSRNFCVDNLSVDRFQHTRIDDYVFCMFCNKELEQKSKSLL